jgi:hypothetical protein
MALTSFHILQVEYSAEELDALAVIFTAVKVLYVGGALARCARLLDPVDAARRASLKPLHMTLIRNEAAYFGYVQQLITEYPPPPRTPGRRLPRVLYLCGDSHCVSGASVDDIPASSTEFCPCLTLMRPHAG